MKHEIFLQGDPLSPEIMFYIYTVTNRRIYVGMFNRKDKTFRKEITEKHKFHKAQALGIDAGLLEHLDRLKCEKIILKEKGICYHSIAYEKFLTKGWQYPRDCNTKAQVRFQPSYIAHQKWWRKRDWSGKVIQEGQQDDDE